MAQSLLITGSEGVIGSILQQHLNSSSLITLDKAGAPDYRIDIAHLASLQQAFHDSSPDVVVHLAADARVDAPWLSILRNNIIGTRNIYRAAHLADVDRVIYASSNHVTGGYETPTLLRQSSPPQITVDDHVRPDSYYASSKLFGEALARQYRELHGIASICLRIGTVIADDTPRDRRTKKTWLSHRDLGQLVRQSITADVSFGIYYGVSDNDGRFWSIANAMADLGYRPRDNAAEGRQVF